MSPDKGILVVGFTQGQASTTPAETGDPMMTLVPPFGHGLSSYVLGTNLSQTLSYQNFTCYVTVAVEAGFESGVLLNTKVVPMQVVADGTVAVSMI